LGCKKEELVLTWRGETRRKKKKTGRPKTTSMHHLLNGKSNGERGSVVSLLTETSTHLEGEKRNTSGKGKEKRAPRKEEPWVGVNKVIPPDYDRSKGGGVTKA